MQGFFTNFNKKTQNQQFSPTKQALIVIPAKAGTLTNNNNITPKPQSPQIPQGAAAYIPKLF
jgi:hypothetical protein